MTIAGSPLHRFLPTETRHSAVAFLCTVVACYAMLGVTIRRLLTGNGSAYRSKLFARTCEALDIKHSFARPYTPRTNGNAERFIQTILHEWAYVRSYRTSAHRARTLQPWSLRDREAKCKQMRKAINLHVGTVQLRYAP